MFLYRWEKHNSLVTVAVHVAMYAVNNCTCNHKSAHKTSVYSRALKTKRLCSLYKFNSVMFIIRKCTEKHINISVK